MANSQPPTWEPSGTPPRSAPQPYYSGTSGTNYPLPPPGSYAPLPRKRRRGWWIAGGVVAGIALLALLGFAFVSSIIGQVTPVNAAATEYFDAIKAHDWATAHAQLSAALRGTTKPSDLETTWLRREQADGAVERFAATNTNINNTNGRVTATISGTLAYHTGASDPKIITLVKEDGAWKLSRLP